MKKLFLGLLALGSISAFAEKSLQLECKNYSFFHSLITKETTSLQKNTLSIPKTAGNHISNRNILAENDTHSFVLSHLSSKIITVTLFKKLSPYEFEVLSSADFNLVKGNVVSVDFNVDSIQARLNCKIVEK